MWEGSVTEITVNELSAEDLDTMPEGLEFIVTPPSNGYLALKSAPSRHILNFTQSHIQTGQLLFVHSGRGGFSPFIVREIIELLTNFSVSSFFFTHLCAGAPSGGFHFQVNDGVNFAPRQIFSTTARSLVLTLQRNYQLQVYPGWPLPAIREHNAVNSFLSGAVCLTGFLGSPKAL